MVYRVEPYRVTAVIITITSSNRENTPGPFSVRSTCSFSPINSYINPSFFFLLKPLDLVYFPRSVRMLGRFNVFYFDRARPRARRVLVIGPIWPIGIM